MPTHAQKRRETRRTRCLLCLVVYTLTDDVHSSIIRVVLVLYIDIAFLNIYIAVSCILLDQCRVAEATAFRRFADTPCCSMRLRSNLLLPR